MIAFTDAKLFMCSAFVYLWSCCNLFECCGAVMKREACSTWHGAAERFQKHCQNIWKQEFFDELEVQKSTDDCCFEKNARLSCDFLESRSTIKPTPIFLFPGKRHFTTSRYWYSPGWSSALCSLLSWRIFFPEYSDEIHEIFKITVSLEARFIEIIAFLSRSCVHRR